MKFFRASKLWPHSCPDSGQFWDFSVKVRGAEGELKSGDGMGQIAHCLVFLDERKTNTLGFNFIFNSKEICGEVPYG